MIKQLILGVTLLASHICSIGQDFKRNNNWPVGYHPVVIFNFNDSLSVTQVQNFNQQVAPACALSSSSAAISDTNGNIACFTNGFILYDRNGYGIENGTYINCPDGNLLSNYYGGLSLFPQTSIILPKKGNQYYVFSTGMSDSAATNYLNFIKTEFDVLNYSVVDMDSNVGKGKVIQKNIVLADDRHYTNTALTAVRHGNGKDWWLVKADCENHRYEEYIVRADTIEGPYYQYHDDTLTGCHSYGQIIFSNDGSKMACSMYASAYSDTALFPNIPHSHKFKGTDGNWYIPNRADIYDFDRCTGSITFRNTFYTPYDTTSYPNNDYKNGICLSPNNQFLYVSHLYSIHQIDVTQANPINSQFISGPDTVISAFPWYDNLGLAPDGNIYIGNVGTMRNSMSFISQPNNSGLACNFKTQGLKQNLNNILLSPPNMPNYGLGWMQGCTPAGVSNEDGEPRIRWSIFPNPVTNILYIRNAVNKKKELYNSVGQCIFITTKDEIDVSTFVKGLYYLKCEGGATKLLIE